VRRFNGRDSWLWEVDSNDWRLYKITPQNNDFSTSMEIGQTNTIKIILKVLFH
jgi:hypothetical protein